MGLWNSFKTKNNDRKSSQGISLSFEKGIDPDLRNEYIRFVKWLRKNYIFPIHINVYVLNCEKVKLLDGRLAYGSFRWYSKRNPRIKIPSLINYADFQGMTKREIYDSVLSSLVHELTHYYQWLINPQQDDHSSERQANYYRFRILDKYYKDTKRNFQAEDVAGSL